MPDPLLPEELDYLKSECSRIFHKDPIKPFCCSKLLDILIDQWDSGQMPIEWHDKLIPIKNEIDITIFNSQENSHEAIVQLLQNTKKIIPNII